MIDFDFVTPTKLYFGKGKENEIGNILESYNFTRILIIIGSSSVEKSGLLQGILEKVEEKNIEYKVYKGVRPNPTIQGCRECIKIAKEFKPQLLLAVGGGSTIDCAKNVACGYYYDGDSFDFNTHKAEPKKALPIGVILTISAAGSEMSSSCVIQDDESSIKSGFNSDLVRPLFAIENPELSYSVSPTQTAYGIVDIMMHTLERYLCESNEIEPADDFALAVLKNVVMVADRAYKNPNDYEARSILMLMSSLSHNDLTNIGKKKGMPVHALEHAISGLYPNVAHAAGLAVVYPNWAKYYMKYDLAKFAKLSEVLFNKQGKNLEESAKIAIEELENLFRRLNMPLSFKDLGIENPDINRLVSILTKDGSRSIYHHKENLDKNVALAIYEQCR